MRDLPVVRNPLPGKLQEVIGRQLLFGVRMSLGELHALSDEQVSRVTVVITVVPSEVVRDSPVPSENAVRVLAVSTGHEMACQSLRSRADCFGKRVVARPSPRGECGEDRMSH